jgi:hypothetical protein
VEGRNQFDSNAPSFDGACVSMAEQSGGRDWQNQAWDQESNPLIRFPKAVVGLLWTVGSSIQRMTAHDFPELDGMPPEEAVHNHMANSIGLTMFGTSTDQRLDVGLVFLLRIKAP